MLFVVVVLWALNLTVTRYLLTHGFQPLAYATLRYTLAALIFLALTLVLEGTLRVDRRAGGVIALAIVLLVGNQLSFVYALDRTTASTVGLVLGATPIFAALFGLALGRERLGQRFWIARDRVVRGRGARRDRRGSPRLRRDLAGSCSR